MELKVVFIFSFILAALGAVLVVVVAATTSSDGVPLFVFSNTKCCFPTASVKWCGVVYI